MAESIAARDADPVETARESRPTLASLFLTVERQHQRAAVVERHVAGRVDGTPDWRFHRHVLRVALYLRERCGLRSDERVALAAPVGPAWLIFDWATVIQGATTVVVDERWTDERHERLRATWEELNPRVALVRNGAAAARLLALPGAAQSLEHVVFLEETETREGWASYTEVLDLGGTLDTAERANMARARARTVAASQVAAVYLETGQSITNGDLAERVRMPGRAKGPAVVHVAEGTPVTPALHAALYGYVADGTTCTAFDVRS
jgi:acyl-CoA synthetase (AMP-forming)/AMP-acid ligase II